MAELSPADPRNYLGFAIQSALGAAVPPTHFAAYVSQITFGHNPNIREIRDAGGGDTIARTNKDFVAPGARFAMPIRPDAAAAASAAFFGADAITGAGDPYTHDITKAIDTVYLSIERNASDALTERIEDAFLMEVTYDFRKRDSGPELMMTCDAGGLNAVPIGSPAADSYEAERPYRRSDCAWTVDAAGATNVESASFTFKWAIDEAILADGLNRQAAVKLHLTGSGTIVQLYNTAAEADAYLATHYGTPAGVVYSEDVYAGDLNVVATKPGVTPARVFSIDLPAIEWTDAKITEPDPEAGEAVRLTREWNMIANPGGEPVTVSFQNAVAAAYV